MGAGEAGTTRGDQQVGMDWEERKRATVAAMENPQVGDRFHEMYTFWAYVVDAGAQSVTVYEATGHPSEFPGIGGRVRVFATRAAFREAYQYGRGNTDYVVQFEDGGNDVSGWVAKIEAANALREAS